MLRLSQRGLRVSRIVDSLRTVSSVANDIENVTTAADLAMAFMTEHQIAIKGAAADQYKPYMSFESTPFVPKIRNVLTKEKFDVPSPIQAMSWPIAMDKKDIISVAKTGSGKTLGFLLPGFQNILQSAANRPAADFPTSRRVYKSPQVLVLAPTRELGNQIAAEAHKYRMAGIDTVCLYGGASKGEQMGALRRGADCVVATPGRCNDLIDEGAFDISQIRYLVLDEADRMLDMGFEPQIRQIIDQLPTAAQGRQTLFFTATWPKEVRALASEFLTAPVQVNIGQHDQLNANKDIKQHVMIVKEFQKQDALLDLLEQKINVSDNPRALPKTIVFASTKAACDELQFELRRAGYNAAALHGDKSQNIRDDVMSAFRRGKINILIATDIAARGLDVKDIENVVNFSFPNNTEDYVHRIGRTARAGATGTSYTFLNLKDLENKRNMSDLVGVLSRCGQEVPAPLEEFREGRAKHSQEARMFGSRARSPHQQQQQRFGGSNSGGGDRAGRPQHRDRDAQFNGYGNGLRNYSDRERRPAFRPASEGDYGGRDNSRGRDFSRDSGNGKYAGRQVRYEDFAFDADDFDDLDAARRSMRSVRK